MTHSTRKSMDIDIASKFVSRPNSLLNQNRRYIFLRKIRKYSYARNRSSLFDPDIVRDKMGIWLLLLEALPCTLGTPNKWAQDNFEPSYVLLEALPCTLN